MDDEVREGKFNQPIRSRTAVPGHHHIAGAGYHKQLFVLSIYPFRNDAAARVSARIA
jgi:hypothetical protein